MRRKQTAGITAALAITALSAQTVFAAGFVNTAAGVKYDWGSGDYCTNNWVHYKNHWYYFGNDQLMRTGWIQRDDTWYFAADTGELNAGAMKINGNVYYFDKQSCKMVTGYQAYDFDTYYFTESGTQGKEPYVYVEWNSDGTIWRGEKVKAR